MYNNELIDSYNSLVKIAKEYGYRKPIDFVNNLGYLDFYDMEEVGVIRNILMLCRLINRGYSTEIQVTSATYYKFKNIVNKADNIKDDEYIKEELKKLLDSNTEAPDSFSI